jgi:ABC-type oligopeptide transport system substrate-binding subunit
VWAGAISSRWWARWPRSAGLGFATQAQAATPTKPAPGEKLAKEQVFRYGGGGYFQNDPASHDFNKDLYCSGVPALFAGLMVFTADFVAVPWMASKVEGNKDGSVWTFNIRKDSRWSDNAPVSARDFEWSWKRQLDPASAAPYASFLYDIKNGEAFNKKKVTDPKEVGVRAKDDWTLEVTLEGPRGYFPVLAAYLAALPANRLAVEKFGDKWTEAGNLVSNGPFTLEAWDHNKQIVLKKNPHYFGAKDVHLSRVIIPIVPVATGALPYENNELDLTLLQAGDLKRLQSDARMQKDVFRYPFPGTWYLLPQVTKPPFDNLKVRRAVSQAVDRDNVVKVAQGLAIPAWSMIPPGFPGAVDDPKIKAIQKFDKKAALEHLKGTPFEGGKNWPKITLTMRDEALGAKPLAEAVQAVLLDNLNMKSTSRSSSSASSASACGSRICSSSGSAGSWTTPTRTTSTSTRSMARRPRAVVRPGSTMRSTRSSRSGATPVIPRSASRPTRGPRRSCRTTRATSRWPGWCATPRPSRG